MVGSCVASIYVGYDKILLTFVLSVARNIPTQFHEGKVVSIAMISNLQIFLVGLPILVILGPAPQTSFFVRSVIIWMNDFVVVTLIFSNLMYSVHFQTEWAEPEAVKAAIGHAIEQYAPAGNQRGFGGDRRPSPKGSSQVSGPKGSQTSGMSRTPPAAYVQAHESLCSSVQSEQVHQAVIKDDSVYLQTKEITLTRSDLEQNYESLRQGESYRRLQESCPPSQSTPLPRSMMASSVSTQVHGNLTAGEVKQWSGQELACHVQFVGSLKRLLVHGICCLHAKK